MTLVAWLGPPASDSKYVRQPDRHCRIYNSTFQDLVAQGITLVPFFISTEDKPFDIDNFYAVSSALSSYQTVTSYAVNYFHFVECVHARR